MNTATSQASLSSWLRAIFIGLATFTILLAVILFASFGVLRSSTSSLEYVLEETLSRILDRELQIGELLEAELNWDSYLLANDVSLANPAWAEEPDFARVGRLLIRINLPSIWRDGPVLITELELTDASVSLLAPDNHPPTWDFWPSDDEQEMTETEEDWDKKT